LRHIKKASVFRGLGMGLVPHSIYLGVKKRGLIFKAFGKG
jgi:hypothetical protein